MAMLLKGTNGNEFEMGFTREERPDVQDGHGDNGWATVNFRAAMQDDESWEESSPAMNLYEFNQLADWLEALAVDGEGEGDELELLQPELKFTVSQRGAKDITIRIGFHLADRPEEFETDASTDEAQYLDVHVSRNALRAAAGELRKALEQIERGTGKDDLRGDDDAAGMMGVPDDDLNLIDRVVRDPPGAGRGEDNAGER